MVSKIFLALAKRVRQLGASMAEKQKAGIDEHEQEHFILYHGLAGSSPENKRGYKDVRADIRLAVQTRSSLHMAIALKLAPLWWDEKLKKIFTEIVDDEKTERSAIALLPDIPDEPWPSRVDPLGHADWRVRANAATILAFIGVRDAAPRMVRALNDSVSNTRPAFPHIAYALGKLGVEQSRSALEQYLTHEEPWMRVDAAGALASYPVTNVGETLMQAMLDHHPLSDYMAVAISRQRRPIDFLQSTHPHAAAGACGMIIAIVEASKQTFANSELVEESGVLECVEPLLELACAQPTPLNLSASRSVLQLVESGEYDHLIAVREAVDRLAVKFRNIDSAKVLQDYFNLDAGKMEPAQLRQAVILAGETKLVPAIQFIIPLLDQENILLDEAVEALGKIGDEAAVKPLLALAGKLVDMRRRTGLPIAKQPTAEDNIASVRTYWRVLKALGEAPSRLSLDYLLEATNDFAPDKRDQAYSSLLAVYARTPDKHAEMKGAVTRGLGDPSPQVRATALEGVSLLADPGFIDTVLHMTDSAEVSVSRKAFDTLGDLIAVGPVKDAVQKAMNAEPNQFKKDKLAQFLTEHNGKTS